MRARMAGAAAIVLLGVGSAVAGPPDVLAGVTPMQLLLARVNAMEKEQKQLRAELAVLREQTGATPDKNAYSLIQSGTPCPAGWTKLGTVGMLGKNTYFKPSFRDSGAPYGDGKEWMWIHPDMCFRYKAPPPTKQYPGGEF